MSQQLSDSLNNVQEIRSKIHHLRQKLLAMRKTYVENEVKGEETARLKRKAECKNDCILDQASELNLAFETIGTNYQQFLEITKIFEERRKTQIDKVKKQRIDLKNELMILKREVDEHNEKLAGIEVSIKTNENKNAVRAKALHSTQKINWFHYLQERVNKLLETPQTADSEDSTREIKKIKTE
ncbi:uncharacterized protein [Prorops nasuta]|uniref:uncharacterized protein isoform X2 n=1 Tax=Prorops nasuta TaxID=863751 RepID=UPI0034CF9781